MSFTLAKKELKNLFSSPIAYVFIVVFLFLSFWLFFNDFFVVGQASLRTFFSWTPLLFTIFLPSITMGCWSEEKRMGTHELLLTLPAKTSSLVLGKFFGCVVFFVAVLALTLPLPITISFLGEIDWGVVLGSYFGLCLLGFCYLSFGLNLSFVSNNQIVSYLLSILCLFFLYIIGEPVITAHAPKSIIPALQFISFSTHFESLARGVVDSRDVLYFLSLSVFFLYLNILGMSFKKQRWISSFVLVSLAIIVLVLCNLVSLEFSKRLDLTKEKEFSLSQPTKKILKRLDDRLTIKLYYSKNIPAVLNPIKNSVNDLINEIKATSDQNIYIENVAPDLNDEKEQEAMALGIVPLELNIKEKDKIELKKIYFGMVLYYQDKKEVIPVVAQIQTLEYKIDLAILKLTQKQLPRIGLLVGQQNERYSFIQDIIKQIATPVIIAPEDRNLEEKGLTTLLVIHPVELEKDFMTELDRLLSKGTNVILFAGNISVSDSLVPTPVTTGMDDWLANKGVEVSDKLLIDLVQNAQAGFNSGIMQVYLPYGLWVRALQKDINREHPITAQTEDILYPWTNVLKIYDIENNIWDIDDLVTSSNNSFLQPEDTPDLDPNYVNNMETLPTLANYPLSVVLTNKKNKSSGKLFITATQHIVQNRFLNRSPANIVFLSNMLEFASWGNHLINIRSRGKTDRPLKELTQDQKNNIKWILMIGVPAIAVILGLFVLFIYKKKRERYIRGL